MRITVNIEVRPVQAIDTQGRLNQKFVKLNNMSVNQTYAKCFKRTILA